MSVGAADTAALAALGVGWVAMAVSLLVVRRKPQFRSFRWVGGGLLVMLAGGFFSQFAVVRHWPHSQRLLIDGANLVLGVAGIACVVADIAIRARSRSHQT